MDYNNNEDSNSQENEELNTSSQNLNEGSDNDYNSTFNYNNSFNNDYNSSFNSNFNAPNYNRQNSTNGLAIASLIVAILSIPLSCCYGIGGIISAIAGIILAIVSRKYSEGRISGMAIASIVISIIGFILGIIMLIAFILVLNDPELIEIVRRAQNGYY
ncbi:hypothetical protein [[Clostridium] polysaccharolyticum]|uniref:DUF4190 domain-containing protein n=1 Tax=[Clostridium] polysaccharolyticum TaxID=29364 RepID=A0A1I0D5W4_9FIRM|nr:hypothetical protein [[Clostridium] polysaccharolyticum]SET27570.1 hypothetical protein SAMN04487772_11314 [[Clostridium] polysaccharolyticum]